jgi:hypothetical protein
MEIAVINFFIGLSLFINGYVYTTVNDDKHIGKKRRPVTRDEINLFFGETKHREKAIFIKKRPASNAETGLSYSEFKN